MDEEKIPSRLLIVLRITPLRHIIDIKFLSFLAVHFMIIWFVFICVNAP